MAAPASTDPKPIFPTLGRFCAAPVILIGYQTYRAAVILIAFVILTLIFAHPFWTFDWPSGALIKCSSTRISPSSAPCSSLLFLDRGAIRWATGWQGVDRVPHAKRQLSI
jgi:hypothetical protein